MDVEEEVNDLCNKLVEMTLECCIAEVRSVHLFVSFRKDFTYMNALVKVFPEVLSTSRPIMLKEYLLDPEGRLSQDQYPVAADIDQMIADLQKQAEEANVVLPDNVKVNYEEDDGETVIVKDWESSSSSKYMVAGLLPHVPFLEWAESC